MGKGVLLAWPDREELAWLWLLAETVLAGMLVVPNTLARDMRWTGKLVLLKAVVLCGGI